MNPRKPINQGDKHIDIYYEQFSEPGDKPTVTIHNSNGCYEFTGFSNFKDLKEELKRMRKDGEWFIKMSEWLDYKFRNGEL